MAIFLPYEPFENHKCFLFVAAQKECFDATKKDNRLWFSKGSKEYGNFYAVFTVCKQLPEKKAVSRVIALDPNHKNLCYGVDTEGKAIEIASPNFLKMYVSVWMN